MLMRTTTATRPVYLSFHHQAEAHRARLICKAAGLAMPAGWGDDEDRESAVLRFGPVALQAQIDAAIARVPVLVVLIGRSTRGRQWVNYEIFRAWNSRKGVLGIHVHSLPDESGHPSLRGSSPFEDFTLADGRRKMSSVAPVHEPPSTDPNVALAHISQNVHDWIDEAVRIRRDYKGW